MMELRQIKHVLALVETGSIGRAAQLLDISQPALSKSIQRLERGLGVQLFDRSTRGTTLTRFGKAFLAHARVIAAEVDNAEVSIRAMRRRPPNTITVGVSPSLARSILPIVSTRFLDSNRDIQVHMVTGMLDELLNKVLSGELEFAVVAKPDTEEHPGLEYELLIKTQMEVVASDNHPLRQKKEVQLEDLLPYHWVLPSGEASGRKALNSFFSKNGLKVPIPTIESDSITYISSLVQETNYLSYLPLSLIHSCNETKELKALCIEHCTWSRSIVVNYRKRLVLPKLTRRLMMEFKKALVELEGGLELRNKDLHLRLPKP